jgi:P-type conjugative transfer protein TrbJ
MHKSLLIVLSFAVMSLAVPAQALVVTCPACSGRATQILERSTSLEKLKTALNSYREDIQQTQQQIALVQNNIQQYQNMLQNTLALPSQTIDSLKRTLGDLAKKTTELNILKGDYLAMGQVFDTLYPGLDIMKGLADGKNNAQASEIWAKWSQESDRATQATFQLSALQLKDLAENSDSLNDHITRMLDTPEGQMQAISAGNNLAAVQISEAQKLRGLIAAAVQSSAVESAKKEKDEQLAAERWHNFAGQSELLKAQQE